MALRYTFNRQTLFFRTHFELAGTKGFLATNSWQLHHVAESRPRTAPPGSRAAFEMELIVDPRMNGRAQQEAHFRGLRHLVFASLPPQAFLVYDLLRRQVRGVLSDGAVNDLFWNSLLMPITIGMMGTTMGVAPLHCACLDRGGNGVLVAGISGAGKSTLTAALGQRGFGVVSDEWTYISRRDCTLVAHGLGLPIKLLPDAAQFFPQLRGHGLRKTLNGEIAYEIEPRETMGCEVRDRSRPRWIFFLERREASGCSLTGCQPDYIVDFFEKSVEKLPEELSEAKQTRKEILHQLSKCPAWIVRTGEGPQQTAGAIERFLAEASDATA